MSAPASPRRLFRAVAGLGVAAAVVLPGLPAAAAPSTGYVRLAHLSPDTPEVDVYLSSQTGSIPEKEFPGVGYGALSDYLELPTGSYAVAMRKAGAPESEKPVLTTEVTVEKGGAYTVAGVGRFADLGLRVLEDDLRLPPAGAAKVRIIQASVQAPVLDVAVKDGAEIGADVTFASTTDYRQVDPGRWTVEVQPANGGASSSLPCTLAAGSVYSLLILDSDGGLKAQLHTDAGRQGVVPAGGVDTGAGGTAPGARPAAWPGAALAASAAAVLAFVVVALAGRRRRTARA
ncbi:DUF4397 domain-containing protein [Spirilliplanes yamanashiensis]|uniref:DUF4397 domain-containing protein n=1 Tax=Spirilliplanes yamanashiensis TaxID=42233 RepID=A0A8J3Y4V1_9ACTN|nr:DUF4397 domain-containing protein [Spirilliplanes yamanashiensis]MDP9819599.1 hypothetical protein [Spirilliplanes yamanashiensis]GIJ01580.1 hypothetical protein Sya03_09320 [Spirilliplanes yamanashiensis]